MQRTIMHVDLDAFFVAVEQARDPSLRGRPVIVGGDPDSRGVVATASYEARVFGIYSGQPLRTAKRLCPHAVFLRGDYRAYQRASRRFHAIVQAFSPIVEPGGLDEAYVDLTGCRPLVERECGVRFPDATPDHEVAFAAGEEIRQRVRAQLGIAASAGIATARSVAKIASDAAKPDGLLAVAPGDEAAFLAPRPVRHLPGLGPKAEAALARAGIKTIGQLARTPPARLRALFASWGPALAERGRGVDPTPVGGRAGAKTVSREGTYAEDVADRAVLRASLRGYAESVGADLRRMGRRARCVNLKLRFGDFTTITRSRTLARPTFDDEELYRTAADLLSEALDKDPRAVRLLGVGASQLVEDEVQLGLFDRVEERSEALLKSIDALREKYGHRVVEKGLTFFDPYVSSDAWEHEKRTGLSSQLGRPRPPDEE